MPDVPGRSSTFKIIENATEMPKIQETVLSEIYKLNRMSHQVPKTSATNIEEEPSRDLV